MIKISANISKKVPIPGTDFSSQQFGAAMEIEVSDADKAENIQVRIGELYGLLSSAIDQQLAGAAQNAGAVAAAVSQRQNSTPSPAPMPANTGRASYRNGGNGNGRKIGATEAQQRAIYAICKSLNLDMNVVLADFNVTDASQLSVKDASRLIDALKSRQNNVVQNSRR